MYQTNHFFYFYNLQSQRNSALRQTIVTRSISGWHHLKTVSVENLTQDIAVHLQSSQIEDALCVAREFSLFILCIYFYFILIQEVFVLWGLCQEGKDMPVRWSVGFRHRDIACVRNRIRIKCSLRFMHGN